MTAEQIERLMIDQCKPLVITNITPGSGWGDQDPLSQAMIADKAWFALADYCEEQFYDVDEGRHFAQAMRELAKTGEI